MNSVDKTKFTNEEGSDEMLKAESGFGMPLKCVAKGKDMLRRVKASTMAFVIPGCIGCIGSNITLLGGRGRLLKGIGGITKRDKEIVLCSQSKEELHTRLLNARGISPSTVTKLASSTRGTISATATLTLATWFDKVVPMKAKDLVLLVGRQI